MANFIAMIGKNMPPTPIRVSDNSPDIIIAKVDGDPSDGTRAPTGSIVQAPSGIYYYKYGVGDTNWKRLFERTRHLPIVSPGQIDGPAGTVPDAQADGPLSYIVFDGLAGAQAVYRNIKIPSTYLGNASFHIHWTKSDDTDVSGETVRFKLTYSYYNGNGQEATTVANTILFDGTYIDSGTSGRIVYRSPNISADSFTPGNYLSAKLEKDTPASGTPMDSPAVVTLDFIFKDGIIKP